ncbi:response regulator transcription factor [Fodinisporobacter ferrooxydans]|uniref:Response regulator transcription factor n=1 Tax=Fodinisporobacter ferrooxydans TaxID=2901836 RepID=A0ABY4CPV1_9BACL|nr:response regulator transcription factor [Alicyclobacillaceae bacterium MYW30-H2]
MKSILIVDDEEKIREVIVSYLNHERYQVFQAESGTEALRQFKERNIDLVILDLMLPDVSGEEVCQKIRNLSPVPILMLTAKVAEKDRVNGLAIGADDYVVKPFSPRELVARVKALLRRSAENELLAERISFQEGQLMIDSVRNEVYKNGEAINVTPIEYKLLVTFARYPGRTFHRNELLETALGHEYEGDLRVIDQHIKNLRHKIEDNPKQPVYLITVFGFGYKFQGGDV